jgi:hypothetical protein
MEMLLSIAALVVGGVGVALAMNVRSRVENASRAEDDLRSRLERSESVVQQSHMALEAEQNSRAGLESRLAALERDLEDVRATLESTAPPPLPRARTSDLDDLRQQLRAAQREEGDDES